MTFYPGEETEDFAALVGEVPGIRVLVGLFRQVDAEHHRHASALGAVEYGGRISTRVRAHRVGAVLGRSVRSSLAGDPLDVVGHAVSDERKTRGALGDAR